MAFDFKKLSEESLNYKIKKKNIEAAVTQAGGKAVLMLAAKNNFNVVGRERFGDECHLK